MNRAIETNRDTVTVTPVTIFQSTVITKQTTTIYARRTFDIRINSNLSNSVQQNAERKRVIPLLYKTLSSQCKVKSVLLYFSIFVNDRGKTRKMIVSRIGAAVATEDANGSIMRNVLELLYTPTCNNSKRLCGPGNDPHCTGTTLCQHVLHGLRKIVFEAITLTVSILQDDPFFNNFSKCDTISAMYGKSKLGITNLFTTNPNIFRDISALLINRSRMPNGIEQVGKKLFLAIYQAPHHQDNQRKIGSF